MRIKIAYALPKVGLTLAGGVGVVYIDQHFNFLTSSGIISYTVPQSRLPEYGQTILEKNYLLATHTLRIPFNTTKLHINIKDRKISSQGNYKTSFIPPADHFTFASPKYQGRSEKYI